MNEKGVHRFNADFSQTVVKNGHRVSIQFLKIDPDSPVLEVDLPRSAIADLLSRLRQCENAEN